MHGGSLKLIIFNFYYWNLHFVGEKNFDLKLIFVYNFIIIILCYNYYYTIHYIRSSKIIFLIYVLYLVTSFTLH